jgi:pimeloyl-ACP methyl ester carboxylesterase
MFEKIHTRAKSKNLIIFIHGISGGQDTWKNSSGKSFPELLLEDKVIKAKFDMAYFSYHSSLLPSSITAQHTKNGLSSFLGIKPKKIQANLDIENIANSLSTQLEAYASGYKSIYIIAHSMGGLVTKQLLASHRGNKEVQKIKLIASLAVPHNGAALAAIGTLIYPLLQVKDMDPLSDSVKKINQSWIDNKDANPRIIYFQGLHDEVVKGSSSIGYDANGIEIKYCEDSHSSICKPESVDSVVCTVVRKVLLEEVQNQSIEKELTSEKKPDLAELEEEDFVIKLIIADVNEAIITNSKRRFFDAELTTRVFIQLGLKDEIQALYKSIGQIYSNAFGDVVTGKILNGNELVNYVHKQITAEDQLLLKSLSKIKFTDKIGMIHQMANSLDYEIWWAVNHKTANMEEYKLAKSQNTI